MEKICKRCGKTYPAERHLSRYCSPTCRQYAYLERHGLTIKNAGDQNTEKIDEEKTLEPNESKFQGVNDDKSVNDISPVNDVIDINEKAGQEKKTPETVTKKIPMQEIKKSSGEKSVNDSNGINNQLGALMEEIKQLRKQVNKSDEQNKAVTETKNKKFDELLQERMKDSYGEEMFVRDVFYDWTEYDFKYANYVNERIKSHFSALIKLHKAGEIDAEIIKTISERMGDLKKSFEYDRLPGDYPYRNLIAEVSDKLNRMVERIEEEDLKELEFSIPKELRVEMKAAVIEIGKTVPEIDHSSPPKRKPFNQNYYYLNAKRRGFDILKDF